MRLVYHRDDATAGHGRVVVACVYVAFICQLLGVRKEGALVLRVTRQQVG